MLFRSLTIECKDTGGVLARITKAVSDMKLSIESMTARTSEKDNKGVISLNVRISSPEQLDMIINRIKSVRNVDKVYRTVH